MTVTASLLPGASPRVRLVVPSIPEGAEWVLRGTVREFTPGLLVGPGTLLGPETLLAESDFAPGGYSWVVPGGFGVGDGGQVSVVDVRTPGNVSVQYTLEVNGAVDGSDVITVPFQRDLVLQTLDGRHSVDVELLAGSLDVGVSPRVGVYPVPGRGNPVVRYDVPTEAGGQFRIRVPMADTSGLRDVLASGGPVIYRFGADSFDLAPVGVVAVVRVENEPLPTVSERWWTLGYVPVDDPVADVPVGAFTWDQLGEAMTGRTWDDFGALFAGETWDDFNITDWTTI